MLWFMENITISPKDREEPLTFTLSSHWKVGQFFSKGGFSPMIKVS